MKFYKKVLKNGLRVVTVPMKDNPTATVLVLVETGSKYETSRVNGISHFLEHMCFKGTEKRPTAMDISKELDSVGSQYNAFTSQEYTGYYAKSDSRHFEKIFNVISDVYLNSTFPKEEIEKEKGVIIEEINMYEDMPSRHVGDLLMKLLYNDQPAGWNIAGTREKVSLMKRADFIKYRKQHYVPSATTLVVSGDVKEKDVLKLAKNTFGKMPNDKKKDKKKTKDVQKKPEALLEYKKTDQAHMILAFRGFDLFDKKSIVLSVLAGVLGQGMSSRLFQKLREEMGVGYYVRAHNNPFTDHGFFSISAGVDKNRVVEVLEALKVEIKKLKEELVSDEELSKTKEYLIGNMKLSLEASDDIANYYGIQELLKKKIKKPEDRAKVIRKVTARDLKKVANEIFISKKANFALIGPYKNKEKFTKHLDF